MRTKSNNSARADITFSASALKTSGEPCYPQIPRRSYTATFRLIISAPAPWTLGEVSADRTFVDGGACRLVSRNRNAFKTFEPLAQAPVLLGPPVAARPVGMGTQVSDFGHLVPNSGCGAGAGQCFHASKTDFGLPKSLPGKP